MILGPLGLFPASFLLSLNLTRFDPGPRAYLELDDRAGKVKAWFQILGHICWSCLEKERKAQKKKEESETEKTLLLMNTGKNRSPS